MDEITRNNISMYSLKKSPVGPAIPFIFQRFDGAISWYMNPLFAMAKDNFLSSIYCRFQPINLVTLCDFWIILSLILWPKCNYSLPAALPLVCGCWWLSIPHKFLSQGISCVGRQSHPRNKASQGSLPLHKGWEVPELQLSSGCQSITKAIAEYDSCSWTQQGQ